jgi:hypothetical protein
LDIGFQTVPATRHATPHRSDMGSPAKSRIGDWSPPGARRPVLPFLVLDLWAQDTRAALVGDMACKRRSAMVAFRYPVWELDFQPT